MHWLGTFPPYTNSSLVGVISDNRGPELLLNRDWNRGGY